MKSTEEIISIWKENRVGVVRFNFSCGGDSMGDTSFEIEDEDGGEISCPELENYFEDEVYKHVDFYEASDGHYQGEQGNVTIELNSEENDFDYSKWSESEWSERHESNIFVELSDEMVALIKAKVLNINGSDTEITTNFKEDCVLNDDEEALLEEIEEKIRQEAGEYTPETVEGELGDWFTFTTNDEGKGITFQGNSIKIEMSNEVTVYREE